MGLDSSYNTTSAAAYMGQTNQGICPDGWHVPDEGEWNVLEDYVDARNGAEGVGTSLKSRYLWASIDSVVAGTDRFGFALLPADDNTDKNQAVAFDGGVFRNAGVWLSTETSAQNAWAKEIAYRENFARNNRAKKKGQSVRCLKDDENTQFCGNTAYDPRISFCDARDNRIYKQVTIGTQTWMAENLDFGTRVNSKVNSKANNQGNATAESAQKYCYKDSAKYCDTYGGLYQWHTAMAFLQAYDSLPIVDGMIQSQHRGICPEGWHIPDSTEWATLAEWVDNDNGGEENDEGRSLKSTTGWNLTPGNGTNDYGFNALSTGYLNGNSVAYHDINGDASWWLANDPGGFAVNAQYGGQMASRNAVQARFRDYDGGKGNLLIGVSWTRSGRSIRCVKD